MKPSISMDHLAQHKATYPSRPTSVGGLIGQLQSEICSLKRQVKQFDWLMAQKDLDSQHLKSQLADALQHLQNLQQERFIKNQTPKKRNGFWGKVWPCQ